jgi:uncharacterized membrane protein YhaH (DUF805 family)
MNEYLAVLGKYAVFQGRASRREYWMFLLVNCVISIALGIIGWMVDTKILGNIYALALLVPSVAVAVRRLHDTNRSGWWFLFGIIPIIGWITFFVFMVQKSREEGNLYGEGTGVAGTSSVATSGTAIADFIGQSRAAGQTDEQIKAALLGKGWAEADVVAGFAEVA